MKAATVHWQMSNELKSYLAVQAIEFLECHYDFFTVCSRCESRVFPAH